LFGFLIETDGANDATLTIYDNTAGSGKVLRKMIVPGADRDGGIEFKKGREADTGIYATISGTGAAFWVDYQKVHYTQRLEETLMANYIP